MARSFAATAGTALSSMSMRARSAPTASASLAWYWPAASSSSASLPSTMPSRSPRQALICSASCLERLLAVLAELLARPARPTGLAGQGCRRHLAAQAAGEHVELVGQRLGRWRRRAASPARIRRTSLSRSRCTPSRRRGQRTSSPNSVRRQDGHVDRLLPAVSRRVNPWSGDVRADRAVEPAKRAVALLLVALLCTAATPSTPPAGFRPAAAPLRVATSGDYPPFSRGAGRTSRSGLDIAIATRLAHDLGLPVEIGAALLAGAADASGADDFDIAMSGVTMRARPRRRSAATRARTRRTGAVVRRSAPPTRSAGASVAELNRAGVRIAVNAGGHLEKIARARASRAPTIERGRRQRACRSASDGQADAVAHRHRRARRLAGSRRCRSRCRRSPWIDKAPCCRPTAPSWRGAIDEWMVAREADGWLDAERVRCARPRRAPLDAPPPRARRWPRLVAPAPRR